MELPVYYYITYYIACALGMALMLGASFEPDKTAKPCSAWAQVIVLSALWIVSLPLVFIVWWTRKVA